jgi:hypothetical protein
LVRTGNIDELRFRADAGDRVANERLVEWLADRDNIDELQVRAVGGDADAARVLIRLARANSFTDASLLVQFGLNPDGSIARGGI